MGPRDALVDARPEDAHDLLGTYYIVSDDVLMSELSGTKCRLCSTGPKRRRWKPRSSIGSEILSRSSRSRTLNVHVMGLSSTSDVAEAVRDITKGGAHVSVEALGATATFENSLRSLRKLGRHVQIGAPTGPHATVSLPLLDLVYTRQLAILGMRGLGSSGFPPLLDMVEAGALDLSALVTVRRPLSRVGEALVQMDRGQPAGITVIDDLTG